MEIKHLILPYQVLQEETLSCPEIFPVSFIFTRKTLHADAPNKLVVFGMASHNFGI